MNSGTAKQPDFEGAIKALEKMAETPNASRLTLKEQLAEERMYAVIDKARKARYSMAEIAGQLKAFGIETTPTTLAAYLRQIKAEKEGRADGKANKKRSEPKSKPADNPSPTAKTEISGDNKRGGKTLTQKPGMGGAFSENL